MRVAILGCGAMGTVMGAFMTKNGQSVDFIDNYQAHVDALNKDGAKVIGFADFTVPVHAITPDQMEGIYDVVFLFTKQTANEAVLPNLVKHLGPNSTVCTLQNGVPEPFVAKYVGKERTVGGAVLWSATFVGPGVSQLTQDVSNLDHFFDIGEIDGKITDRIQIIAKILDHMGHANVSTSLMASRWGKLVYNACTSGMSAACGCTFGDAVTVPKTRACLAYLAREVKTCCDAEGYKMPTMIYGFSPEHLNCKNQEEYEITEEIFWKSYQAVLGGKASMLQDLEAGRKTEVTMINGYVCEIGRKHGIPTPFNDKVVEIVTKIENKELPLSLENVKLFDESLFTYKPWNEVPKGDEKLK